MAGIFDTSKTTSTALPSWFTNAQQNIAGTAGTVYGATPAPGETALKGVGETFNTAQNPFTTAMGGLQDVYQGISTPFDASGQPNPASPLGSLFASQYAKLDQILPQITAKEGAAGIGSGNFNSLRGQTANAAARAGALTTLTEQQNQALLNAQTQGIQALQGIGNIGSQYGTTGINLANTQMLGGLPSLAKYSDIVNNMGAYAPKTVEEINKGSTAENISKGLQMAIGAGKTIDNIRAGTTGIGWLDNWLKGNQSTVGDGGAVSSADFNNTTSGLNPDGTLYTGPISDADLAAGFTTDTTEE
jgi:hypothetical protein